MGKKSVTQIDKLSKLLKQRIVVIGAGITGYSFAATLVALGVKKFGVADTNAVKIQALREHFPHTTIESVPWDSAHVAQYDLILTSPGLAPHADIFPANAIIWGDYELAWHLNEWEVFGHRKQWIAITGTNGKTTTTMMCETIARRAGLRAASCGNIGTPVLEVLVEQPEIDYFIVEMSSFQLYYAPSFHPHVGVVLNIAHDHIDWHGSFVAYQEAKYQILTGNIGVICLDDPVSASLQPTGKTVHITVAEPPIGGMGIDAEGYLYDNAFSTPGTQILHKNEVKPLSPAGWTDALAASALMRSVGVSTEHIAQGLRDFSPAMHRGETVGYVDSIPCIDNSKATNPHAAMSAIADTAHMYPDHKQILIVGGQLKGADVTEFAAMAAKYAGGVVAFGQDVDILKETFSRTLSHLPVFYIYPRSETPPVEFPVLASIDAANTSPSSKGKKKEAKQHKHTSPPGSLHHPSITDIKALGDIWEIKEIHDHSIATDPAHKHNSVDVYISLADFTPEIITSIVVKIAVLQARLVSPAVVLLAPAAASLDLYNSYGQRGELFARCIARAGANNTSDIG